MCSMGSLTYYWTAGDFRCTRETSAAARILSLFIFSGTGQRENNTLRWRSAHNGTLLPHSWTVQIISQRCTIAFILFPWFGTAGSCCVVVMALFIQYLHRQPRNSVKAQDDGRITHWRTSRSVRQPGTVSKFAAQDGSPRWT
ncbi:hypothetical protein B0H13DRAFT_1894719 [Mycena leptocephala]|nr:hypothetical protein B0H13DRAFT_1894719 [Mycena leptocephala]